jgi:hypothetical protein
MMHNNGFVLAVKDSNKKILRELSGRVFLPFYSEYSLFLKNINSVRAVCSVSIDGTDVLGGEELIVGAGESIDLERFLADGNLTLGRKFKFVPLSDSKVQDPSSSENGLIEVRFWKEKSTYVQPLLYRNVISKNIDASQLYCSGPCGMSSFDSIPVSYNASFASNGATVEGDVSRQTFSRTSFEGKDGESTILRLALVGREETLTVEQTRSIHCTHCGRKSSISDNFCGKCGTKLDRSVLVK